MTRFLLAIGSAALLATPVAAVAQNAATPAKSDLCALISNADLQTMVHQAVQGPQRDAIGTCIWRIGGMNAITIQPNETGKAGFDNARTLTANTIALSGVGDDAFAFVSQAGFVQISLVKNNRFVVVIYQGGSNATRLDATKAIAAKVADGL